MSSNGLRKTKSENTIFNETQNEIGNNSHNRQLTNSRYSLKSYLSKDKTKTWYKPKPLQLPYHNPSSELPITNITTTVIKQLLTNSDSNSTIKSHANQKDLETEDLIMEYDRPPKSFIVKQKQQPKEELTNPSALSFDEESLIFNEYLSDSNNFPLLLSTGQSTVDTNHIVPQGIQKQHDDNSLTNFCTFTNSSILTFEENEFIMRQQLKENNAIEIYDNILLLQQRHAEEKEKEKYPNKTQLKKQISPLSLDSNVEPREYEFCSGDVDCIEGLACNTFSINNDDEFFLISSSNQSINKEVKKTNENDDDDDDDECEGDDDDDDEQDDDESRGNGKDGENIIVQEPFYFLNQNDAHQQMLILNRLSNIIEEDDDNGDGEEEEKDEEEDEEDEEDEEEEASAHYLHSDPVNDTLLDELIDHLNAEQKIKFEFKNNLLDDENMELYESLKEFNDDVLNAMGSDVEEDNDIEEEKGTGYTVFYPNTDENSLSLNDGKAEEESVSLQKQQQQQKPFMLSSLPITALKIQSLNEENCNTQDYEDNYETDDSDLTISEQVNSQGYNIEEEIILIGEKSDIKNLLSNENNQLANFFKQSLDPNYELIAQKIVKNVVNMALDKVQQKSTASTETTDLLEYYENLEKNLLIVRNEIDKLKNDAYLDLEYISNILHKSKTCDGISNEQHEKYESHESSSLKNVNNLKFCDDIHIAKFDEAYDDINLNNSFSNNNNDGVNASYQYFSVNEKEMALGSSDLEDDDEVDFMDVELEMEEEPFKFIKPKTENIEAVDDDGKEARSPQPRESLAHETHELSIHEPVSPLPHVTHELSTHEPASVPSPPPSPRVPSMRETQPILTNKYDQDNFIIRDQLNRDDHSIEQSPKEKLREPPISPFTKSRTLAGSFNVTDLLNTASPVIKPLKRPINMTTQASHTYKSLNNLNKVDKIKLLDKCLKMASHNVSLMNLNDSAQIKSTKSFETQFLNLNKQSDQAKSTIATHNIRIPSSRNFCGRLLSGCVVVQPTAGVAQTGSIDDEKKTFSSKRLNTLKDEAKISNLFSDKSSKDLRFFVSNSYSPSLIIKPPSPTIKSKAEETTRQGMTLGNGSSTLFKVQSLKNPITEPYNKSAINFNRVHSSHSTDFQQKNIRKHLVENNLVLNTKPNYVANEVIKKSASLSKTFKISTNNGIENKNSVIVSTPKCAPLAHNEDVGFVEMNNYGSNEYKPIIHSNMSISRTDNNNMHRSKVSSYSLNKAPLRLQDFEKKRVKVETDL